MARECDSATCDQSDCSGCQNRQYEEIQKEELNVFSEIKKVIGVISGKGGVGKSFVTASLANLMAARGFRVGILDADITGPSIPRMFGIKDMAVADENGIYPILTENDLKVMSINLMLPTEDTPVIWRGPVLANMVKQFWTEVVWGDLDYLFVDMPPGTGDVPLTVFQSLPVDGVVIVSSPQDLVQMIVRKAYRMADMMQVPVLGMIENYSYVKCPDCGSKIEIFGKSQIDEIAASLGIPVLGKMPVDMEYAKKADSGQFHLIHNAYIGDAVQFMPKI